jgi:hypothetical protein
LPNSSTHLALLKYPLLFARQLRELTISQMYHPLEDSFVAAILTWNPMLHLQKFQLNKGNDTIGKAISFQSRVWSIQMKVVHGSGVTILHLHWYGKLGLV